MCWEFSELMHHAVPELHIAAFADRLLAHRVEDDACATTRARRPAGPVSQAVASRSWPCRQRCLRIGHCGQTFLGVARHHQRRTVDVSCACRRREAGLFIGADGARIVRIADR